MFGHSPRTALTIAASLAQIGEFAFILAGLGMALNLLPQAGQNLVLAGRSCHYAEPGAVCPAGKIPR
jgi:CPA2 family monovalent cation:H+ antiporter-2